MSILQGVIHAPLEKAPGDVSHLTDLVFAVESHHLLVAYITLEMKA